MAGTRMYVGIKANYYMLNLAALHYLSQALDLPLLENLSLSLSLSSRRGYQRRSFFHRQTTLLFPLKHYPDLFLPSPFCSRLRNSRFPSVNACRLRKTMTYDV